MAHVCAPCRGGKARRDDFVRRSSGFRQLRCGTFSNKLGPDRRNAMPMQAFDAVLLPGSTPGLSPRDGTASMRSSTQNALRGWRRPNVPRRLAWTHSVIFSARHGQALEPLSVRFWQAW